MRELRPICIVVIAVSACATAPETIDPYYESSKSDGARPKLVKIDSDKMEIDEPSDLVMWNDKLYTVSDVHSKIYEISKGGKVRGSIDVEARDLEALAIEPSTGQFVIADEGDKKIWFVDDDGDFKYSIEIDDANDGNSGIEGLAYDDDGHLFVAKEKDPARIYELDNDGNEVDRTSIELADDLSALAWNPRDGHLYALSDAEQSLYRLDNDLDADAAWRLPMDHPEGLAFDGKTLFIVSDSEERIYEFELEDD